MSKRTVVITGVAGGIGSATAEVFADNDWHVVGVDRHKPNRALCGVHDFIEADISDREAMLALADRHGDVDRIVHLAAQPGVRSQRQKA